jgi:hypothetical protein
MGQYATLDAILAKDAKELTALKQDVFTTERLGDVPFTAIDYKEFKTAKTDAMKMVKDGTGGMVPDVDEDKLMIAVIISAVEKDQRSDFTFANAQLIAKLQKEDPNVVTAAHVVQKLLLPGEILNFAK